MKTINEILKERRIELDLTMLDVAKKVGVSEGTISRWESGNIANMKRDKIAALADALDISPSVIMGWNEPTEDVSPDLLTERNVEFLELFSQLSEEQQKLVVSQIKGILSNQ